MNGQAGIPLVLLAGGLLILGVAMGAATQKETFIGNEVEDDPAVGSDVVFFTAMLCGIAVALAIAALARGGITDRAVGATIGGMAAWFLLFLIQFMAPNYVALKSEGIAFVELNNLLLDAEAAPTVLLPVFALGILLMAALAWAVNRAGGPKSWSPPLSIIRRDHLAVAAIAIPFLVVTGAGFLKLLLDLPGNREGAGLASVIHPLAAAACGLLAVTIVIRARLVALLRHDADRMNEVQESWKAIDRIDLAAIITLALVAVLTTFLPPDVSPGTGAGNTLQLTLRSHGQAIIFLAVILLPLHFLHRRIGTLFSTAPNQTIPKSQGANRAVIAFAIIVGIASLGAVVATFATGLALVPWIVALVPSAIAAAFVGRPQSSALVRVVAAWALWAKGNTLVAHYDASQYPVLEHTVHPGLLALWRMAAAAMVAWVVFDVMRDVGRDERTQVVVPLALAAAVGAALVALLEMPLHIWAETTLTTDKLALGSMLVSQQSGVQAVMHILATIMGLGASLATARLLRPDWFIQRANPAVAVQAIGTPG